MICVINEDYDIFRGHSVAEIVWITPASRRPEIDTDFADYHDGALLKLTLQYLRASEKAIHFSSGTYLQNSFVGSPSIVTPKPA